jgi:hypothetical protein
MSIRRVIQRCGHGVAGEVVAETASMSTAAPWPRSRKDRTSTFVLDLAGASYRIDLPDAGAKLLTFDPESVGESRGRDRSASASARRCAGES